MWRDQVDGGEVGRNKVRLGTVEGQRPMTPFPHLNDLGPLAEEGGEAGMRVVHSEGTGVHLGPPSPRAPSRCGTLGMLFCVCRPRGPCLGGWAAKSTSFTVLR